MKRNVIDVLVYMSLSFFISFVLSLCFTTRISSWFGQHDVHCYNLMYCIYISKWHEDDWIYYLDSIFSDEKPSLGSRSHTRASIRMSDAKQILRWIVGWTENIKGCRELNKANECLSRKQKTGATLYPLQIIESAICYWVYALFISGHLFLAVINWCIHCSLCIGTW